MHIEKCWNCGKEFEFASEEEADEKYEANEGPLYDAYPRGDACCRKCMHVLFADEGW